MATKRPSVLTRDEIRELGELRFSDDEIKGITALALAEPVTLSRPPRRRRWPWVLAGAAALALLWFVIHGALMAFTFVPAGFGLNNQRCTFADGSSVPGTCMFIDEFNGSSIDATKWIVGDDWGGPIQASVIPELGCFRHENVTETGGNLVLAMTANARASCPQTWSVSSYYTTNYGTNWPTGQATSYDLGVINMKTFNFTYGHVAIRMQMPGGTGPGGDVSLWGSTCQTANGLIGAYNDGFFAHNIAGCRFPASGSNEQDIPNYAHGFGGAPGNLNASIYVPSGNGAPSVGTFFTTPYFGALASNQAGVGDLFSPNPSFDPSAGFHTYETDWRPSGWTFSIDGVQVARNSAAWITAEPEFLMFWNADQITVDGATLPQLELVDYVRITCPPGVPCTWTGP